MSRNMVLPTNKKVPLPGRTLIPTCISSREGPHLDYWHGRGCTGKVDLMQLVQYQLVPSQLRGSRKASIDAPNKLLDTLVE